MWIRKEIKPLHRHQDDDLLDEFLKLCEDELLKNEKSINETPTEPEQDQLLTVPQAAEFLSLSIATIYGLVGRGELPVMKRSKRCYFSRLDLIEYLKVGRRKTVS
jgi:excisionase family DNA binding protein